MRHEFFGPDKPYEVWSWQPGRCVKEKGFATYDAALTYKARRQELRRELDYPAWPIVIRTRPPATDTEQ